MIVPSFNVYLCSRCYALLFNFHTILLYVASKIKQETIMKLKFEILSLMLINLLIVISTTSCRVYYVKPTIPSRYKCPTEGDNYQLCKTLNGYIKHQKEFDSRHEEELVIMVFLKGYHIVTTDTYNTNFGSPLNSDTLHIKGNGDPTDIIIKGLETMITANTMIMIENVTAIATRLYATIVDFEVGVDFIASIMRCNLINSVIIMTKVNLTVENCNVLNSTSTAISLYSSTVTFAGYVRFVRNRGYLGGALMLVGTTMKLTNNSKLYFKDNHATETGGAIHVVNPATITEAHKYISSCFYQFLDYGDNSSYALQFINNTAKKGGDHIFGASLKSYCIASSFCTCLHSYDALDRFILLDPGYESALSAVSADATRVCICVNASKPKCDEIIMSIDTYPGGKFTIPAVLVGGDYGTTIGTVYAFFMIAESASLGSVDQAHQVITINSECSLLNYSVFSNKSNETLLLAAVESLYSDFDYYYDYQTAEYEYTAKYGDEFIHTRLRNTPVFINVILLPCPPGFVLLGDPPGCNCHPILTAYGVECILNYLSGYHKWNTTSMWIQATSDNTQGVVSFSTHCSFDYCKPSGKHIDLMRNPNGQCTPHREGILCGRCTGNYSLAIGSSHCIHCPNNNNLALLIFFAGAGVLLVLVIAALNLTVTQGAINSLVFYANIIWAYQNILFPPGFYTAQKTFIAWLNLDFGIEVCFIRGMDAYLKMWLQFIFPFYIAGLFLIGLRYSSKLSKLFGSRSVPTLATLLYLSYSKLLRTIIACIQLAVYYTYSDSGKQSTNIVWALDGNLSYGNYPHIFLLLTAIACFLFLWLPYTVLLFFIQWLRRIDHYRPLNFLAKYKPIYDAYFAPLNDKHQYWFGTLLLAQGGLLLVSSLTSYTIPDFNLLFLLAVSISLLCYMNTQRTYKQKLVSLLESSFLANFIVLTVGTLYFRDNEKGRMILLSISITIAFFEFCVIVTWNLIPKVYRLLFRKGKTTKHVELSTVSNSIVERYVEDDEEQYMEYCDPILDQS